MLFADDRTPFDALNVHTDNLKSRTIITIFCRPLQSCLKSLPYLDFLSDEINDGKEHCEVSR